eukprot:2857226-Alexandrium_andersonii.AAC.1
MPFYPLHDALLQEREASGMELAAFAASGGEQNWANHALRQALAGTSSQVLSFGLFEDGAPLIG